MTGILSSSTPWWATETDCPNCSRELHVHDLCECDHELGPYCGPCCRAYHQERP